MESLPNFDEESVFNHIKDGVWGKIGSGGGCEVHYLQTVMTINDLSKMKIISEINESEKWPIQDLFQRNVNKERVRQGIIPYLENPNEIKFFNPLTILLLPVDVNRNIINDIPFLRISDDLVFSLAANRYTFDSHYSMILTNNSAGNFGRIQWNDNNCFLVAIDGQHRLFALKELLELRPAVLSDWRIPTQIVCIHKSREESDTPKLIEAVRRIFVSINDKAQKLSSARKILLNDLLPLDVATQSVIDYAHQNSGEEILPLYLFDWRGDTTKDNSKLSILSIEELNLILNEYFQFANEDELKKRGSKMVPDFLRELGISRDGLDYGTNKILREELNKDFIPAIHILLRRILKINLYVSKLEEERMLALNKNKVEIIWAFEKEMYGEPSRFLREGEVFHSNWDISIREFKSKMPELLQRDIGLRSIFYVFSTLKTIEPFKSDHTWKSFAEFLILHVNEFISTGWLMSQELQVNKKLLSIMTNLVYDGSGKILNYRMTDVPKGLGALLLAVISAKLLKMNAFLTNDSLRKVFDDAISDIKQSYEKDIRKEVKIEISMSFLGTPEELKKEIKKISEKRALKKISEIETYLTNLTV